MRVGISHCRFGRVRFPQNFSCEDFEKHRYYYISAPITKSMESLLDFALQERYRRVSELGDKVAEFDTLIKWEQFRSIL